ncbi:MAG: alpha/beta hydrolase [Acidimicrobiales bacterium]
MEFVSTVFDGYELVAGIEGEGRTIVLIPGHTMSIDRWLNFGYVDDLSAEHRVVVVDPLGHGRSSNTSEVDAYGPDQLVAHLLAVFDRTETESADVWGYSRGALMAGLLARHSPERVKSLIYGGNVLFDPRPVLAELGLLPSPAALEEMHARAMTGDWSAYWGAFPHPLPDALKADIESRNDLGSISASGLAVHRYPVRWEVPEGVPTLAYWGSGEIFHQLNIDAASEQNSATSVVGGAHAEAFALCRPAIEVAKAFWGSID